MNRYSMIIQWSDEYRLFLVTIPEFAERVVMPCTHENSRTEAIHNGEEVIQMYLETWQAQGDYPYYKKFAKLSRQEEDWGLLEDWKQIDNRRGWQKCLEDHCAELKGHRVVW